MAQKTEKLEVVKVHLVGGRDVGKTSLMMQFLMEEFASRWHDNFPDRLHSTFSSPPTSSWSSTSSTMIPDSNENTNDDTKNTITNNNNNNSVKTNNNNNNNVNELPPKNNKKSRNDHTRRTSSISAEEELGNIINYGPQYYSPDVSYLTEDEVLNNEVVRVYSRRYWQHYKQNKKNHIPSSINVTKASLPTSRSLTDTESEPPSHQERYNDLSQNEHDSNGMGGVVHSSSMPELKLPSDANREENRILSDVDFNRKKLLRLEIEHGVQLFNQKPRKGIEYLISAEVINDSPEDIAAFLQMAPGLSQTQAADYLTQQEEIYNDIRKAYFNYFNFRGKTFEESIRYLLAHLRLPVESQKIERVAETYGEVLVEQTDGKMPDASFLIDPNQAFLFFYSILMAHTALYNKSASKARINKNDFFTQLQYCHTGVTKEWSNKVFDSINSKEIKGVPDVQPYEDLMDCSFKYVRVGNKIVQVRLVDDIHPPGQNFLYGLKDAYIKQGDGFVLVFDITDRFSFESLASYRRDILRVKSVDQYPMIIVGCKTDESSARSVSQEEGELLAEAWNTQYFELSNISIESSNIHQEIMHTLASNILKYQESNMASSNCRLM